MDKGLKLDVTELENAVMGGTILGGGGGGSATKGRIYGEVAVKYSDLYLQSIENFSDDDVIITASLVGAPKSPDQYMTGANLVRAVEILKTSYGVNVAGIITNENGGEATINGWLQASVLGIPLIDAPCNGRAHPTGVMGSMNLHKNPEYITTQAAVGGNPEAGRYIECLFTGTVDRTARLVRQASIEAGGLVGVARNPVTIAHAKKNNAISGISHAIKTGKAFRMGLEISPERAVSEAMQYLGGCIVAKGVVRDFELRGEGGFDVGFAKVDDIEMTFWNEYMTLDQRNERRATFPDLIMTFDAKTGEPLPTSMIAPDMEIFVATTASTNLQLSATMFEADLLKQCEEIVGRDLVSYMRKKI